MRWPTVRIRTLEGESDAVAPLVVSASRRTDIPALHMDWFMHRLREGYVKWVNPFSGRAQYVSFEKTRAIVFWSKNPAPLMPHLDEIRGMGLGCYFLFTLNDYDEEGYEPGVPGLDERVETFRELSSRLGRELVVWRFDPLLLTDRVDVGALLKKVERVGERLRGHTSRLVFSFAIVDGYRTVRANLRKAGIGAREATSEEREELAAGIGDLARRLGIEAATCSDGQDFSAHGIGHNRCIDDELLLRATGRDPALLELLGLEPGGAPASEADRAARRRSLKDKGQRKECRCIVSKDIGQYGTCSHLCVYCYANHSRTVVRRNLGHLDPLAESILPSGPDGE